MSGKYDLRVLMFNAFTMSTITEHIRVNVIIDKVLFVFNFSNLPTVPSSQEWIRWSMIIVPLYLKPKYHQIFI